MAYSEDTLSALAELARATGALKESTGKEKDDARQLAMGLIQAQTVAQMQTHSAIEQARFEQNQEYTKEAMVSYKNILDKRVLLKGLETKNIDAYNKAIEGMTEEEIEEREDLLGGTGNWFGFGKSGQIRRDFKDMVNENDKMLNESLASFTGIIAKKKILGPDSPIIDGTKQELLTLRQGILNAKTAVETAGLFDPSEREGDYGKPASAVIEFFSEGEVSLLERADEQIEDIDTLISLLD
jgi:hypothetical protein